VFDRDTHPFLSEAFSEALNSGIQIAFSSVCFEFWIWLHVKKSTKNHSECDDLIKEIDGYDKASYDCINGYVDLVNTACKHASEIVAEAASETTKPWQRHAYTNVHELVADLREGVSES